MLRAKMHATRARGTLPPCCGGGGGAAADFRPTVRRRRPLHAYRSEAKPC